MKKVCLWCAALLGTTALLADMPMQSSQTSTTMPNENAFVKLPEKEVTPALVPHGMKVVTSADFIWWKTTIDDLEYVAAGVHNGSLSVGTTNNVHAGKVKSAGFDFQPGFKVALGLFLDHDGWDVNAQYTWLNPSTQVNSVSLNGSEGLISSYAIVDSAGGVGTFDVTKASSSLTHHFNVLDVMLGRDFFISKYLSLKPQAGAKFAWTKDKYNLTYTAFYPTGSQTPFQLDLEQKMFGVGIRAGMGSVWHLCENWSLYGNLMFSGLWSYLKESDLQFQSGLTTCNNNERTQKMVNVVEYAFGLGYTTWFCDDSCQFSMKAGWEQQTWLGYNNLLDVSYLTLGNMNMQGLTVEMGFAF